MGQATVLQRLALGFENYPYPVPKISRKPQAVPEALYQYEDLPADVSERIARRRDAGLGKNIGSVTGLLESTEITLSNVTSRLEKIETDISLVHAAYYTDDECIDRIARWIAGKG